MRLAVVIDTSRFNITILVRKHPEQVLGGVTVKVVDFKFVQSLAEALKGHDALVDATSVPDPSLSLRLIDAAVAAGVHRLIPAEFSVDPENAPVRALPPFQGKAKVYDHIRKLADEGKITWTAICNNAFLDWSLRLGFVNLDLFNKKIVLMNDGVRTFPWKLLSYVGKAVAGVLTKPDETKNRVCYIYNIQKSQNDMVALAKQNLGDEGWQTEKVDMDKVFAKAMSDLQRGVVNFQVIGDMIKYAITKPELLLSRTEDDNELLGIPALSDEDIKQLLKEIVAEKNVGTE
ncbi:isoflavone reductase family protein [Colletotrichum tofieldiae]|nr:isoflavone reductase family protein [Colletotrichum tofieldiae]GKT94027.1 isoflavone reductase family protein [Colletotrichum tofieldiae]